MTLSEVLAASQTWLIDFSWRFIGAAIVLAIGWGLANGIRSLLSRRSGGDLRAASRHVTATYGYFTVMTLSFVLALAILGIATTVIGFILTVGFGLGILADSFQGFRLLGSQTLRIGDLIELKDDGITGYVMQMGLSSTTIMTRNDTLVTIPNRRLAEKIVLNYSTRSPTRLFFEVIVKLPANLRLIESGLHEVCQGLMPSGGETVSIARLRNEAYELDVDLPRPSDPDTPLAGAFIEGAKSVLERQGCTVVSIAPRTRM